MKDINLEINRLEAIKYEVDQLEIMRKNFRYPLNFLSQAKYGELADNDELNKDDFYYIVEPKIGQYIEGYMDIERNAIGEKLC